MRFHESRLRMNTSETITPMQRALGLAAQALWLTSPNPRVGCVITSPQGQVLGEGHTQQAGGPHAEIMALQQARDLGHSVKGSTAYVTLEPCAHHGRTGPCCDALIEAGIAKVVVAAQDPNPLVAGQGLARIQAAGIEVTHDPIAAQASRELNLGFFSRMQRHTPWVRLKIAASVDGQTALENGQSQWITGPEARTDGHAWRARACAVLTGIGTVLEDDPLLDTRLVQAPRQPHLVIVDSRMETPLSARLFQVTGRQIWIYAAVDNPEKQAALQTTGAQVRVMPGPSGKVDLPAMLRDLAEREVNELHVEAGHKLNGSLVREGLIDEFLLYLAPKLIGQGRGMAQFGPLTDLTASLPLTFTNHDMIGPDLRLLARVTGRDIF
jgi:diaminohydroxyphosphoribosylaminopyrimidine deaminase/5-amino-6-(5-phosphoribosylamino)uracil reductase